MENEKKAHEASLICCCAGQHAPYLEWLLSLVGGAFLYRDNISIMCRLLEKRFYYIHPLDEGISLQAETLRYDYLNGRWDREVSVLRGDASVLEVLITLALKVENDLLMPPMADEDRGSPRSYFDRLLQCIGIDDVCDVDTADARADIFLGNGFSGYGFSDDGKRRTLWEQLNAIFSTDLRLASEQDCMPD